TEGRALQERLEQRWFVFGQAVEKTGAPLLGRGILGRRNTRGECSEQQGERNPKPSHQTG
ncbi:MAG: hypothetical protein JRG94_08940, partial [Deltaproteobacteria bacterium]|nr:hypothetical protein [Deltaproteobacteria bacterium]